MLQDNDKKLRGHEEVLLKTVDNMSANIASKFGFAHVPWFTLTKIVLGIYTAMTCLVLFFRTDFINLTICTGAIYMMVNTDKIKRWTFRALVLGIFLSLLIDLSWFML